MTDFRPFTRSDVPWTAFGAAFGLFYGASFVALVAFWGLGMFLLLLLAVPYMLVQLVVNIGFDRFSKWRRRDKPPRAPTAWLRHHSISLGALTGAALALIFIGAGLLFGGTAP